MVSFWKLWSVTVYPWSGLNKALRSRQFSEKQKWLPDGFATYIISEGSIFPQIQVYAVCSNSKVPWNSRQSWFIKSRVSSNRVWSRLRFNSSSTDRKRICSSLNQNCLFLFPGPASGCKQNFSKSSCRRMQRFSILIAFMVIYNSVISYTHCAGNQSPHASKISWHRISPYDDCGWWPSYLHTIPAQWMTV